MTQLQALLGEDGVRWAIWIGLGFAALLGLLLLIFILKRIFAPAFNMSSSSDRRGRPPRLGVTDFFNLDRAGRRLVIVRRDNVEHLVLVGGPNDILIESNIVRGVRPESPVVDSSGRPMIQPRQADLASLDLPIADPAPPRETFVPKKRAEPPPVEFRAGPESSSRRAPLRDTASDEDRLMADIGSMAAAASAAAQPAGSADPVSAPPARQAIFSEAATPPSLRTPTAVVPPQRAASKPDATPPVPAMTQRDERQQTDLPLNPQPLPPVAATAPELPPAMRTLPKAAPSESGAPGTLDEGVSQERTLPERPSPAEDTPVAVPPVSVAPRRTASFEDVSKRLQEALRRPQALASSAVTTSSARNAAIPSTLKPASFGPGKPAQAEAAQPSPPAGESAAAAALPPAQETRPAPSSTDSALSQIEELDLEQEMARLLGRVPGAKP